MSETTIERLAARVGDLLRARDELERLEDRRLLADLGRQALVERRRDRDEESVGGSLA
jgi:hypothetical protein